MRARRSGLPAAGDALPPGTAALVARALAEDRVRHDATSRALLPEGLRARGRVTSQAPGVLSGVRVAELAARSMGLEVRVHIRDGERLSEGTVVLTLEGSARSILGVERTILNFLMHLSGVATATRTAVERAGPHLEVLATRKTLPGLRDLEKMAVRHGGGHPHRRDLSEALLVKNSHLAVVPLETAVRRALARARGRPVEIEVRSLTEARRAVNAGARALLLDNLGPGPARRVVRELERTGRRRGTVLELSGGVTPENVARYRRVGADRVSLGSLTHSAPALPFHLTLRPEGGGRARRS